MSSTTFIDQVTPIVASWLNDTNLSVYITVPTLTTNLTTLINTTLPNGYVAKDSNTGAAQLPSGTTAQRPTAITGQLRFNNTLTQFEGYNGTAWGSIGGAGGGATGGGTDKAFYENDQTITTDYTLTANKNAVTAGPITIATGVTVTIPSGATWTIV